MKLLHFCICSIYHILNIAANVSAKDHLVYIGLDTRKPVSLVCKQQRRRNVCTSAQTDLHLCYSDFECIIFKLATSREHSGSVVECLIRYLGAAGLSLTSVSVLCS